MNAQTELRDRLHRLAEDAAPPARADLATVVVARHRTRRRQHVAMAAVAAAVLAVVVTVPAVISSTSHTPALAPAPVAAPAYGTVEGAALPAADVYGAATRGSLAPDAAFVDAVRQLPWTDGDIAGSGIPDAPLDSRHVVFAGDVGGARVALVAGLNTARPTPPRDDPQLQTDLGALSNVAVAWFAGPAGATPEQLQLAVVPHGIDPSTPTALFDPATGALVVVAAPGDAVEVSLRPGVARDATITRTWQPATTPDGVAALDLRADAVTSGQAIRYRVTRDGAEPFTTGPGTVVSHAVAVAAGSDVLATAWLRPPPPASPADTVRTTAVEEVLGWTGLRPEQVTFTGLWSGDVPAPTESPARLSLIAATLPSGAVYLSAPLGIASGDGSVGGIWCGTALLPAGPPPGERTVAVRCDVTDFSANSETISSLVVVAPRTAVTARALDGAGRVLAEYPLRDGVVVVPAPGGLATVESVAADGTVLQPTAPLGAADLGD